MASSFDVEKIREIVFSIREAQKKSDYILHEAVPATADATGWKPSFDADLMLRTGYSLPHVDLRVTAGNLQRSLLLIDAIFKACTSMPGIFVECVRGTLHRYGRREGEFAEFRITNGRQYVMISLKELTATNKRRKKYERIVFAPTGKFEFNFKSWVPNGLKKLWRDRTGETLEDHLPEIVATIQQLLACYAESDAAKVAAERRLQRERQRDDDELKNTQELKHAVRGWKRATEMTAFLDRAESAHREMSDVNFREWLEFSRSIVLAMDPFGSGPKPWETFRSSLPDGA